MVVHWMLTFAALLLAATAENGGILELVENTGVNHVVGQLFTEPVSGKSFNFTDAVCGFYFSIDSTATISTKVDVDRESILSATGSDELSCGVQYEGIGEDSFFIVTFTIRVLDENDETPRFYDLSHPVHEVPVVETISPGSPIVVLQPDDKDNGANGTVSFDITGGNEEGVFRLDTPPGNVDPLSFTKYLYLQKKLDFETITFYNLTISISDMGPQPLTSTQYIVILVTDLDDEEPMLATSMFNFEVREDHPVGTSLPIGSVTAEYQDGSVFYSMINSSDLSASAFFRVDTPTGKIYLERELDYEDPEQQNTFSFGVEVQSTSSSLITHATVEVEVVNVNDEPPLFYLSPSDAPYTELTWPLVETEPIITDVLLLKVRIQDNDFKDGTADFRVIEGFNYTVEPATATNYFRIKFSSSVSTLYFAHVFLNQSIDREENPEFTLFLTAYDTASPPNYGSLTIHIPVLDVNDNAPTFSDSNGYFSRIAEDSPIGREVGKVRATDPDLAENGTVVYSITSVDSPVAEGWFHIDPNGVITVNSSMDYISVVEGKVTLSVTAHDSANTSIPQSSTTTVEVQLSPGVTFAPRAFQEHTSYDILSPTSTSVYLEFRTTAQNGLLLYQIGPNNRTFSLGIEGGKVNYQFGSDGQTSQTRDELQLVSNDKWYSVKVTREGENLHLDVWETDRQDQKVLNILRPSTLASCPEQPTEGLVLYVGGQDLLSLPDNATFIPGLLGAIQNLVVEGVQVDLGCPSKEENTALGLIHTDEGCTMECGEGSVCVSFASQPYCSCLGGFPHEACQQDDEGYAPITFTGEGSGELTLGYSFFVDLYLHGDLTTHGRRRRREEEGGVREVLRVSFRPADVQSGTILYSLTPTSKHELTIAKGSLGFQVIIYLVSNPDTDAEYIRVILNTELFPSTLYNVTITTSETHVTLSMDDPGVSMSESWNANAVMLYMFAQAPESRVVIGGLGDHNFTGCIMTLSINALPIPLGGLVQAGGTQFTTKGSVTANCDLCTLLPCPENSSCVSDALGATQECPCLDDFILSPQNSCIIAETPPTVTTQQEDLETKSSEDGQLPFYYIIGISLGGILFLGLVGVILILILRHRYRTSRQKRTYRINNDQEIGNGHVPGAKPNPYTNVVPRLDESFRRSRPTSRANTPGPPDGESVATYQQGEDGESVKRHSSFSRRKSTTSAETGFHTGSDRDERSIPRMEDSGNEKETEYSPFESDSERSTSCVEEAISPANLALMGSSDNVMGVPSSPYRVPLTPKEKKVIEPLRPDSRLVLSMSEFEEETDTEFSFPPKHLLSKMLKGSPRGSERDPRPSNSPSWYKDSTPSDTEREARRVQGTCAYYPPRSDSHRPPFNKSKSMPMPPEYLPPPTFSSHKSASPNHFPHFYPPSTPTSHLVDSPLARLAFKYSQRGVDSPTLEPQRDNPPVPPAVYPTKSQPMRLHSLESYATHRSTPTSPRHYTYSSGFGGSDMGRPADGQGQFQDLKSMKSRINPIAYWEGQSRMKAAVDQVDPYQILSEPYVQFEDMSTQTSVAETSTLTMEETDGPEHQEFYNQGGIEGTADILDLSLTRLPNEDLDSLVTGSTEVVPIKHFPSADCSDEYTHTASLGTLVASSSGDSTPKQLVNGYSEPSSQQQFDV